jgi:hypothetical protein
MHNKIYLFISRLVFVGVFVFVGSSSCLVSASDTVGTIDSASKITLICHDATCTSAGQINWKPTINVNTPGATPVTITDTSITGNWLG